VTELRISVDGEWEPVKPEPREEVAIPLEEFAEWLDRNNAGVATVEGIPILVSKDLDLPENVTIFAYNRLRRRLKVTLD
jgi:hypothetical protein